MAKLIGADLAFNGTCGYVRSIRNRKREVVRWIFQCQRCEDNGAKPKQFPISRWGENAYLAAVNALEHHRCVPRNKEAVLNNATNHG